jgi:hypothetical protein
MHWKRIKINTYNMAMVINECDPEDNDYPQTYTADKSASYNIYDVETGEPVDIRRLVPDDPNILNRTGMYVITRDDPETIIYYVGNPRGSFIVRDETAPKQWANKKRTTINHNNLAKNKNIICGGDFYVSHNKVYINNQSGHYRPHHKCLEYTVCLFKKYGYDAEVYARMDRRKRRTRRSKVKTPNSQTD